MRTHHRISRKEAREECDNPLALRQRVVWRFIEAPVRPIASPLAREGQALLLRGRESDFGGNFGEASPKTVVLARSSA